MSVTQKISLDIVRRALAQPLPGLEAQQVMSPPYRAGIIPREIVDPNYAGVLILLYPLDGELFFPLMRRTEHEMDRHKGQISLPGGRHEASDADYIATALREAREELGIALTDYELLGTLSPLYIPPSNFHIHPAVAAISERPDFHPDPGEVAELIEMPLAALIDPQTRIVEEWTMPQLNNAKVMMPYYQCRGHKVWGATAMVLCEFVTLIEQTLNWEKG